MTYRYTVTFDGHKIKTIDRSESDLTHALIVGPKNAPLHRHTMLTVYTNEKPAMVAMRAMNRKASVVQACVVRLQREEL